MEAAASSTEIHILGWSVVLLLAQIALQGVSSYGLGIPYLLGPRDEERRPGNPVAGRLGRALRNLLETYPAFVGLALALAVTGKTGGTAAAGAWIWIAARVFYVPLYAFGVPVVRSVCWCVSVAGLAMMFVRLMA